MICKNNFLEYARLERQIRNLTGCSIGERCLMNTIEKRLINGLKTAEAWRASSHGFYNPNRHIALVQALAGLYKYCGKIQ